MTIVALMGCAIGSVLLLLGILSTIDVFWRSIYVAVKYRFGRWYFVSAVVALPCFSVPYFIH